MTSPINNQRDHEAYKENFDNLPFERTLEIFRIRKIKEILESFDKKNFDQILEVGPGYNSLSSRQVRMVHLREQLEI